MSNLTSQHLTRLAQDTAGPGGGRLDLLAAKYCPPDPMPPRGLCRDRQGRVEGGGAAQAPLRGQ